MNDELDGEIENCRGHLSTLVGKTQREIEDARKAGDKERRDNLLDFRSDVTEAILIFNRTEIAVADEELPSITKELANLNRSMKERMKQNRKVAQQLDAFAGIIGGVTSLGGRILKS